MPLWRLRDAFALTGTANVSNLVATTTVTGTGTAFDTELDIGDTIIIAGKKRKVAAISSNVSITIDPAWDGANQTSIFVEGQDSPKYVLASEVSGNNILGVSQVEALVSTNQVNFETSNSNLGVDKYPPPPTFHVNFTQIKSLDVLVIFM